MNCPTCLKLYSDQKIIPLNLECGHTFCKNCLYNKSSINGISCYTCGTITQKQIPLLTKNYIALSLGCESIASIKSKRCYIHEGEYLLFFCKNCSLQICPMCVPSHSGHHFIENRYSSEVIRREIG